MAFGARHSRETSAKRRTRFELLYEQHYDAILAYALRRASRDAAHDVVSETFLVTWRRLEDVPRDALPWLYGVARRVLANQRRSGRRRQSLYSKLTHARLESFAEPQIEPSRLAGALDRLSAREREALKLTAWEGLDGNRAAAALNISPTAFRVRLHRARRRLNEELARCEGPSSVVESTAKESR